MIQCWLEKSMQVSVTFCNMMLIPLHKNQDTWEQIIILSSKFSQSTDRSCQGKRKPFSNFCTVVKANKNKWSHTDSPARTASLSSTTRLKIKRMYLEGWGVRGPSLPSKCRILVANTVCSQSSMNSHKWARPVSLLSGFSSMMLMMQSTMARLYSKPPCQ